MLRYRKHVPCGKSVAEKKGDDALVKGTPSPASGKKDAPLSPALEAKEKTEAASHLSKEGK